MSSEHSVKTDKETMAILSKVNDEVKEKIIEKMDSMRIASSAASARLTATKDSESSFCSAAVIFLMYFKRCSRRLR